MTILEPILYANGALRLTRHGAGKGGNVLVLEHPSGKTEQVELTDSRADWVEHYFAEYPTVTNSAQVFDDIEFFAIEDEANRA